MYDLCDIFILTAWHLLQKIDNTYDVLVYHL